MRKSTKSNNHNIRILKIHKYVLTRVQLHKLRNIRQLSDWYLSAALGSTVQESSQQPYSVEYWEVDVRENGEDANCLHESISHH